MRLSPRLRSLDPTSAPGVDRLPTDRSEAVTHLFAAHYQRLVRTAALLVDDRETAEDVVMEAFLGLYRRWTAIRDPEEAYRYVRSAVLNGARSQLRRRRVSRVHERSQPMPEPTTTEDASQRTTVMQQLRALPARQRQVLVLRYYLDLSEADIASQLGISPGSVKTHASRGLAALAHTLEGTR